MEIKQFRKFGMKCHFQFSKGQPEFCSVGGEVLSVCNQAALSITDTCQDKTYSTPRDCLQLIYVAQQIEERAQF